MSEKEVCEMIEQNKKSGNLTFAKIFEDIERMYNKVVEYDKKEQEEKKSMLEMSLKLLDGRKADDVTKTGKHYPLDEMLKELE